MEFSRFLYASVKHLTLEERGELFTAILALTNGDEVCLTSTSVRIAFAPFEEEFREHEAMIESKRACGKMGGAPVGNKNARKMSKNVPELSENNQKQPQNNLVVLEQAENNVVDLGIQEETLPPAPLSQEEPLQNKEKPSLTRGQKEKEDPPSPPEKKSGRKVFKPPTVEEVRAYCEERQNGIDPEYFIASYEAVGWKVGRDLKPMVSWKGAIITWEKNNKKNGNRIYQQSGRSGQDENRKRSYEDSF